MCLGWVRAFLGSRWQLCQRSWQQQYKHVQQQQQTLVHGSSSLVAVLLLLGAARVVGRAVQQRAWSNAVTCSLATRM
jgi:hypothetical protein